MVNKRDTLMLSATITNSAGGNDLFGVGNNIRSNVDPETLAPYDLTMGLSGRLSAFNQSAKFDQESGRVFVSSGKDVKMLDGLTGKELGRFPAGDQVASIVYDADTKLVSALWGGRYINVARVDLMSMTPVQSVDLLAPTRQIFLDPRTHTIFAMSTIADTQAFGRAASPESNAGPRISSLLTLLYKRDSEPHPRSY